MAQIRDFGVGQATSSLFHTILQREWTPKWRPDPHHKESKFRHSNARTIWTPDGHVPASNFRREAEDWDADYDRSAYQPQRIPYQWDSPRLFPPAPSPIVPQWGGSFEYGRNIWGEDPNPRGGKPPQYYNREQQQYVREQHLNARARPAQFYPQTGQPELPYNPYAQPNYRPERLWAPPKENWEDEEEAAKNNPSAQPPPGLHPAQQAQGQGQGPAPGPGSTSPTPANPNEWMTEAHPYLEFEAQPQVKILPREDGKTPGRGPAVASAPLVASAAKFRTVEEREADYQKARERIFREQEGKPAVGQ